MKELKSLCLFSALCSEWACNLTSSYPFIKHFPVAIVRSISHISGCAMMLGLAEATRFHLLILRSVCLLPVPAERETVGYNCRTATGMAMTGNGAILLSSHRLTQWGQLGEILGGVKFPWCWYAASRLMTSHANRGVEDKLVCLTQTAMLSVFEGRSLSEKNI